MKPITTIEARQLKADGAFSFIDTFGTRCTRIRVCCYETITAANCVDFAAGAFLISASVVGL